ncbi:MAG: hypothetical protein JSV09_13875 [Thermoplasmata archaeon]|nr:MAG: hypothetical protein JSV09_13875 [Thermoplasmata archaeon]
MQATQVQVTCPKCQRGLYVQVTGQTQGFVCPFCNFHGQISLQAPQQQAYPRATPPPAQKKAKRSPTTYIVIVVIIFFLLISVILILRTPSSDEEEGGLLEIKRVYHEPLSPGTDDSVNYYAEIVNVPSSYEVVYNIEVYNGSSRTMSARGNMYKAWGSKNTWQTSQLFTSTGFDSGKEVRFWVEIYNVNWEPDTDQTPLLTSETDSFIIS